MKPNPRYYELRICVESIHKGYSHEIYWAQNSEKKYSIQMKNFANILD